VPTSRQAIPPLKRATQSKESSRSKRAAILATATQHFGDHGYENAKWADVATVVGVGSTALYHYFESKLHCLYVIMADALESFIVDFERITSEREDYLEALVAVLRSGFDLTEADVMRNRVLVAEQGLVGVRRTSQREEAARELARAHTRDLEFAWASFLVRGMEQGLLPEADPRLLTRAVLGLNTSVWHWYRPGGTVRLADVADFFVRRQLAVLGLSPDLADEVSGADAGGGESSSSARAPATRRRSGGRAKKKQLER
jgi:AcrR family transcriptional regulator